MILCVSILWPKKRSPRVGKRSKVDTALSARTKKQIDSLPEHAQHIFKEAYANAVKQYQDPAKRRGGKSQSLMEEKVINLRAKPYKKKGG